MKNKSQKSKNRRNDHDYYPFLKWGYLHTPFMIYVRSRNELSDQDFMNLLGLGGYQRFEPPLEFAGYHVVFANDAEWTHIADDFRYTLWHRPQTVEAILELSKHYDLFRNSVGDIDYSFDFEYYQNGKLVRKFVFEHNVFKATEVVSADEGRKLQGEPETFEGLKSASMEMFPTIIKALGIQRVADPLQHRYYAKRAERKGK